jgi:hypothetical protein
MRVITTATFMGLQLGSVNPGAGAYLLTGALPYEIEFP